MNASVDPSARGRGPVRPGAMTMAMRAAAPARSGGPEVLRIGVLVSGRILEERVLPRRTRVLVGTDERNDVVVRAMGIPPRLALFEPDGETWLLHLADGVRGRVAGGGHAAVDLEALRAQGVRTVRLERHARGKIDLGGATLLFQLVPPPPMVPRPQLPMAARGGFLRQIDWTFTAIATLSLMLHFGFVVGLENADFAVTSPLQETEERMASLIFPEPPEPPDPLVPPEDTTTPDPARPSDPVADNTRPNPQRPDHGTPGRDRPSPGRDDAQPSLDPQAVAQDAVNMLLGAIGPDASSPFANLLEGGAPADSMAEVIAGVNGVAVATRDTMSPRDPQGSGETGPLGNLIRRDGNATQPRDEGTLTETHIRIRPFDPDDLVDEPGPGGGTFDSRLVIAAIRARARRIQACYEHAMGPVPVEGKVAVRFDIQESGSVTGLRVTENTSGSEQLAGCVTRNLAGMRFNPGPEGGSVSYGYPFVFSAQR